MIICYYYNYPDRLLFGRNFHFIFIKAFNLYLPDHLNIELSHCD